MRFFPNNFFTLTPISNLFSDMPCGGDSASVDISYLKIGWVITPLRGYKHTHRHTHRQTKGNNHEIKYERDVTSRLNTKFFAVVKMQSYVLISQK